ncbi:glyoxalase/bleomycin resistance/extradiol dioxygenase family protein [Phyllobacterium phragmitis]|uniref:Glyoxalase/bleomycin resistance/extradiol dioxygenase family protein n=1 Tax=Phyllobacterium phragmitis TaxID=2670329 RepID=A0A2S9ISG2_9HYPH|nr:VOC family protein [Phyllobacterium phragmitis]PRD43468.1 glyoxalase/bleomycin resistance/extradiol dioxygenase family protein [Phyllobacterium phragmitis]
MQPVAVLESVLYVTDLPRAIAFYRDVLGLELAGHADHRAAFFRCGSSVVILFDADETIKPAAPGKLPVPAHGAKGPGHLCFSASRAEIVEWKAHLQAHGVEIESEFDWPNGAHSLYFRDPSGNSLEFAEPQLWA